MTARQIVALERRENIAYALHKLFSFYVVQRNGDHCKKRRIARVLRTALNQLGFSPYTYEAMRLIQHKERT